MGNNEVTNTVENTRVKLGTLFLTVFLMCKMKNMLRTCEKQSYVKPKESQGLCTCAIVCAFMLLQVHIMLQLL